MTRVFLTGASGFVGAAVLRKLLETGHHVATLLRPTADTRRIADLLARTTVIPGDMSQIADVRDALVAFKPDTVAHLAWNGVLGADRNSSKQLENVTSAIALYRLTEDVGCTRFLGMGSQAEYGPQAGRIHETDPTRPTTVYGAAKLATCLLLGQAAAAAGRPFTWLRLFSSYGPADDPSWLIPYVIERLLSGQKPSLTAGEQTWDYIHVDDVADAVRAALDSERAGIYNLGSGQCRSLRDIITAIRDYVDPSLPLGFGEIPYRPDQVMHLEADISALTAATGWKPRVSLFDGLRSVVDDYRKNVASPPDARAASFR